MIVAIGYLAAFIDVGQFLPHLGRAVGRRADHVALSGISIASYATATVQAILWTIYGFATDRLPIALPNVIIGPACAVILALAVRSRLRTAQPR